MTYVVECTSCQQAWEVPAHLLETLQQKILVPGHMMLDRETGEQSSEVCGGPIFSGVPKGEREAWERDWPLEHPGRSRPLLFTGAGVKVVHV